MMKRLFLFQEVGSILDGHFFSFGVFLLMGCGISVYDFFYGARFFGFMWALCASISFFWMTAQPFCSTMFFQKEHKQSAESAQTRLYLPLRAGMARLGAVWILFCLPIAVFFALQGRSAAHHVPLSLMGAGGMFLLLRYVRSQERGGATLVLWTLITGLACVAVLSDMPAISCAAGVFAFGLASAFTGRIFSAKVLLYTMIGLLLSVFSCAAVGAKHLMSMKTMSIVFPQVFLLCFWMRLMLKQSATLGQGLSRLLFKPVGVLGKKFKFFSCIAVLDILGAAWAGLLWLRGAWWDSVGFVLAVLVLALCVRCENFQGKQPLCAERIRPKTFRVWVLLCVWMMAFSMPWTLKFLSIEWAEIAGQSFALRLLNGKELLCLIDQKFWWGWGLEMGTKLSNRLVLAPLFCPGNVFLELWMMGGAVVLMFWGGVLSWAAILPFGDRQHSKFCLVFSGAESKNKKRNLAKDGPGEEKDLGALFLSCVLAAWGPHVFQMRSIDLIGSFFFLLPWYLFIQAFCLQVYRNKDT